MTSPPALDTGQISFFAYYYTGKDNGDKPITLNDVLPAFQSYIQYGNYIDGIVRVWDSPNIGASSPYRGVDGMYFPNYSVGDHGDSYVDVHVRVRADGWILAWFLRTDDPSRFLWWSNGSSLPRSCEVPQYYNNRLARAIQIVDNYVSKLLFEEGWETFIGVAGDGVTDAWAGWTAANVNIGVADASTGGYEGIYRINLTCKGGYSSVGAVRSTNLVEVDTTIKCWVKKIVAGTNAWANFKLLNADNSVHAEWALPLYDGWYEVTVDVSAHHGEYLKFQLEGGTNATNVVLGASFDYFRHYGTFHLQNIGYYDYENPAAKRLYFFGKRQTSGNNVTAYYYVTVPNGVTVNRAFLCWIARLGCAPYTATGSMHCRGAVDGVSKYDYTYSFGASYSYCWISGGGGSHPANADILSVMQQTGTQHTLRLQINSTVSSGGTYWVATSHIQAVMVETS